MPLRRMHSGSPIPPPASAGMWIFPLSVGRRWARPSSRGAPGALLRVTGSFGSHPRFDRVIDGAAVLGPVLECAEIAHVAVAEILERLARQGRAAAGGAIDDDRLVLAEGLVVIGRSRIGAEFEHTARHVQRAGDLAGLLDFR